MFLYFQLDNLKLLLNFFEEFLSYNFVLLQNIFPSSFSNRIPFTFLDCLHDKERSPVKWNTIHATAYFIFQHHYKFLCFVNFITHSHFTRHEEIKFTPLFIFFCNWLSSIYKSGFKTYKNINHEFFVNLISPGKLCMLSNCENWVWKRKSLLKFGKKFRVQIVFKNLLSYF